MGFGGSECEGGCREEKLGRIGIFEERVRDCV